jgi:hypothetical protein
MVAPSLPKSILLIVVYNSTTKLWTTVRLPVQSVPEWPVVPPESETPKLKKSVFSTATMMMELVEQERPTNPRIVSGSQANRAAPAAGFRHASRDANA